MQSRITKYLIQACFRLSSIPSGTFCHQMPWVAFLIEVLIAHNVHAVCIVATDKMDRTSANLRSLEL
jgi:hypothetical protein